ncbi:hypothetical protein P175DRAFT_0496779 [Aspergillus ochraceoroseus IBT 24754]|uniref:Metallo-beta-lactamase domain-containing protein n=1 Tax=Aspergillus ochraceoroseus IBT 24754 TaxID=1392256 RepID=A0A2T5LKU6_9EURO|nr:uncharacterized protein P175DRAFT_0496779 [Aspergillus ochraceoroseus IBT 24754]PTU16907.1 hypothetical protein P175DRAFT_0496779 [Aspergillus ochraceoroseus IBT 24754]
MEAAGDIYSIESYQVAVPGGDCSIHLLIDHSNALAAAQARAQNNVVDYHSLLRSIDGPKSKEKRTIKGAVLVDGGYDGGTSYQGKKACASIEKAITDIESRFELGTGGLKFDAWLVTHWDRDHYCGTLQMIITDLTKKYTDDPTKYNRDPKAISDENDTQRARFKHFKYQNDNGPCLTTLYSPVFNRDAYVPVYKDLHHKNPGKTDIPKGRHWRLQKSDKDKLEVAVVLENDGQAYTELTYANKPTKWMGAICNVVEGFDDLWGTDLFTGRPISKATLAGQPVKFEDVIDVLKEGTRTAPVFLIVGAEGCLIGDTMTKTAVLTAGAHALENYISIISLIVWPPSDHNHQGRVSYFNGGDAESKTEKRLADWMNKKPVAVLKTSHHGAYTATPPELLDAFKPSKVLISAGYDYGHPNWMVVTTLFAYWDSMVKGDKVKEQRHGGEGLVFPLRYPYYLEGFRYKDDGKEPALLTTKHLNMNLNLPTYEHFPLLNKPLRGDIPGERTQILQKAYDIGSQTFRDWAPAEAKEFCNTSWNTVVNNNSEEFFKNFANSEGWENFNAQQKQKFCGLFLLITILAEYWSYISSVDNKWGRKHLQNGDRREAIFLWTRSYDSEDFDGRVDIIDNWNKYTDTRGQKLQVGDGITRVEQVKPIIGYANILKYLSSVASNMPGNGDQIPFNFWIDPTPEPVNFLDEGDWDDGDEEEKMQAVEIVEGAAKPKELGQSEEPNPPETTVMDEESPVVMANKKKDKLLLAFINGDMPVDCQPVYDHLNSKALNHPRPKMSDADKEGETGNNSPGNVQDKKLVIIGDKGKEGKKANNP